MHSWKGSWAPTPAPREVSEIQAWCCRSLSRMGGSMIMPGQWTTRKNQALVLFTRTKYPGNFQNSVLMLMELWENRGNSSSKGLSNRTAIGFLQIQASMCGHSFQSCRVSNPATLLAPQCLPLAPTEPFTVLTPAPSEGWCMGLKRHLLTGSFQKHYFLLDHWEGRIDSIFKVPMCFGWLQLGGFHLFL